jgi:hypothetical protein
MVTGGDVTEVAVTDTPGPVENAGSSEVEPTTVTTIGDLPEVADSDTPGPVENAPPGDESTVAGEDIHFLGEDVSTPPTVRVFKTRSMHRMVK